MRRSQQKTVKNFGREDFLSSFLLSSAVFALMFKFFPGPSSFIQTDFTGFSGFCGVFLRVPFSGGAHDGVLLVMARCA